MLPYRRMNRHETDKFRELLIGLIGSRSRNLVCENLCRRDSSAVRIRRRLPNPIHSISHPLRLASEHSVGSKHEFPLLELNNWFAVQVLTTRFKSGVLLIVSLIIFGTVIILRIESFRKTSNLGEWPGGHNRNPLRSASTSYA